MGTLYGVDGDLLERQYRNHLSNYLHWDQLAHAENWLLFEKNIGAYVCIDEVALSRGELYTVLINKETYGGSIIGIIKGTDVCTVTSVLLKLSRRRRYQVREITLDMAPNMEQIARTCLTGIAAKAFSPFSRFPVTSESTTIHSALPRGFPVAVSYR